MDPLEVLPSWAPIVKITAPIHEKLAKIIL